MIIRESHYETISMDQRFPMIMEVLRSTAIPLTARDIASRYVNQPTESDKLVTGSVLNILTLAGLVKKRTSSDKKRINYYVLDRTVTIVRKVPA